MSARPTAPSDAKLLVAIVKPYLAERVLACLALAPVEAVTVREVRGFGRQKSYLDQYSESEYDAAFLPKVEISIWVDAGQCDALVKDIVAVARTGRMGDGKLFILPTIPTPLPLS